MIKECLHCNQEFKTYDRRRKYCDRRCYDAAHKSKKPTQPCEVCEREFRPNYPGRRFCSKECRLKAGWAERDPSKRSVFTCDWCGKPFEEWTYRQPRFCSRQCTSEFAARQPKPRQRRPENFVTQPCAICGELFTVHKCQVELRNTRFCSAECRGEFTSQRMKGPNNPNWNGGTLEPDAYGPNWQRQSRRAKKRDKSTCQACGYVSGGDLILDVHHIVPLKFFDGDWKKANRLSNLVSLCRPCHRRVEREEIPCPCLNSS